MKFLSPDSGFMRGLSDAVDAIWINILMLITSIPIITIGAALTAGHDATRRTLSGEGTATRNYFAAFRSNFAKSTGYWLIFGTTGALCVYSWIVLQITPLLIPKFALTHCVAHRFRMGVGVAGAVRELVLAHAWQRFCVRREQHRPHVRHWLRSTRCTWRCS